MKFTPEQRLEIYEKALEILKIRDKDGMQGLFLCLIFLEIMESKTDSVWLCDNNFRGVLPEFYKLRPEKIEYEGAAWWDKFDLQPRINCLNQCITEVKRLIK